MGKDKQLSAGRHGEEFWAQESKSIGFKLMQAQGWTQGQGLGKGNAGRTNFIRAKKKDDVLGLGAKQGEDDSWTAMTGLYNELLQRLSVEGGTHENGGVSKVAEPEDTSKTLQDYIVKKRLYGRFRKAKDTCGYSESDMAAIMGKKAETSVSKPEPLGYRVVSKSMEKKDTEDESGVQTITSKVSIRDYFSKKMSMGGSRYSAAGGAGFTEEFQEQHYNQLSRVADAYHGKMGLGSGRPANSWDIPMASFASSSVSSFSSFTVPEDKSEETKEQPTEKSKKKKKDRETFAPPPQQEEETEAPKKKKSKKAKHDDTPTTTTPTTTEEPTKKSKKSKQEPVVVATPIPSETEKSKKKKKSKEVVIETKEEQKQEEQKVKKSKKDKKQKETSCCAFCSSSDVPMTCGACEKAFYCGVACQTKHWPTHKPQCKLQR